MKIVTIRLSSSISIYVVFDFFINRNIRHISFKSYLNLSDPSILFISSNWNYYSLVKSKTWSEVSTLKKIILEFKCTGLKQWDVYFTILRMNWFSVDANEERRTPQRGGDHCSHSTDEILLQSLKISGKDRRNVSSSIDSFNLHNSLFWTAPCDIIVLTEEPSRCPDVNMWCMWPVHCQEEHKWSTGPNSELQAPRWQFVK